MRLLRSIALACLVSGLGLAPSLAKGEKENEVLLFSFFRNNGESGVYLAASTNGFAFTSLNQDKPVFPPPKWAAQNLTRDPSIVFHGGKFHMVWTSGWKGNCFGYANCTNLVNWSEPVMVQPFPTDLAPEDQPRNMWAPDICHDPVQDNFAIIWSSTTERESRNGDGSSSNGKDGELDHRMFITRTADGKTFSKAKLFFDQKFCCIDGQMVFEVQPGSDARKGRWILVFKNEKETALGGKNLRFSFASADFSTLWTPASTPVAGPGSTIQPEQMAEGPTLVRWNNEWLLYWDAFANGHYSVASSADLKTWADRTSELTMPPHPRHGTIFRAPRDAVGWFPENRPVL